MVILELVWLLAGHSACPETLRVGLAKDAFERRMLKNMHNQRRVLLLATHPLANVLPSVGHRACPGGLPQAILRGGLM